ncbi:Carboxypeptidase s1 [Lasiodiplodia theobromae]|uniref:Carboxypeptidase s1 n=1 Tax=Lasiodiplodia theobromae TaxID=45133 RepID=UPI0015C2DD0B|nr:Carboxypeptidase s1 [Lasiodiplodia theobromae]KAF4541601.1 Carboxypeptidase s1 [Lasiodiplodia theobromae]
MELSIRIKHDFSGPSQRTIETATADHLLAHVEQLRLQHLPHKGSKLDRVCTWAVYFTGVVQREIFVKTHEDAARLVLGACHTLLELCERQIDLVHTAFALFNDIGRALTLSTLASAHTELVRLAVDVALYCERGGGTAGEFDAHFAARADTLFARRGAMVDVLWKHCTSRHNKDSGGVFVEMDQIRRFLAPAEGVVQALASRRWRSRGSHDHVEYTCEWFEPLLQDFFAASDDTVYHITGPSGCGKSELAQWIAERMRCCLETDQCEVFAFFVEEDVRTEASGIHIARGLLLQLFESSIGNLELYEELSRLVRHDAVHDVRALEQALWAAIELGLRNRRAVLLVDGLDHLAGEDDGARVLDHLHRVTSKSPAAKAFVLSAPLERHASSRWRLLSIGEEHTRRDLERVFEKAIASAFPVLSAGDHSTVNQRLVTLSSGSFTHATLALELAKRIVQKILGRLRHEERNEMRLILAWMLAAERPLSISEVRVLLEVDVGNLKTSMMITDIKNDLYRAIGPLIRTDGEVLRFKHPLIRRILVQLASDTRSGLPFNMQEAHSMLVSSLLRYTSKYWAIHFKHSSMYSADGEHSLTAEFRNAFPASTGLAVLEFTRWEGCTLPQDAASFFEIALQIRQSLIPHHGDAAIIQTLLALARVYRRLSWFSSRSSSNLATLAAGYIDSIENMTVREELLHFLHKGHVDRAIEVQEELYHVCVKEYGIQHAETMSIHRDLVALLREEGRTEQLSSHERRRWMTIRDTLAPDDAALIAAALDMVAHHEERNEFTEAKAVFTYMLESMSREMHDRSTHDRTEEAQNVLIGVWTQYHEALHVTDISETELSIILTSLWSYFKRVDQRSSSLAIETAQSLSITSKEIMEVRTSRTTTVEETPTEELEDIFSSLTTTTASSFCSSSSSSTTSTSAHSSIITTADTLSALYEQRSDWTRATTTTVRALEIVWPSILETNTTHSSSNSATLSSTLSSTKDISVTLSTARRLAHCHFAQRRVRQAEAIHVRIFEAVMRQLGVRHEHFLAAAEELVAFYETVFRFEDAVQTLEEAYAALKDAFEVGHDVVIKIAYRLGRLCHELQMLERARDVFEEIVVALCGGGARGEGEVLRWGAVEAAIALCELHGGFRCWDKALQLYERLWRTLVEARGEGHGWTHQMVERLYHGYVGVLETEARVEYGTLVQVTVEFRRKSAEMFGERHEASIDASLRLAEVYERSEEHHELAISMYETVISMCSSSFDESTVTKLSKSRQRLAYLYSKHTATSSQGFSIFEEEVRKTALVAFSSRSEVTEIRTATLQLLEKVVRQIAISEKRKERHIDSAHSILTMFKELGSLDTIQTLTRSLRQHSFTFIVALEKALLTTSQSSMQVVSFDELEETLKTECRLHQDYTRAANANAFSDTITHGCRLVAFLQHHGRTEESESFEIQLRSHFAGALDSTDSSAVLQDFFDICVREMGSVAASGTDPLDAVIAAAAAAVRRHLDDTGSRKGFELAGLVHQFLRLIHGGVAANMQTVLQLALWLAGRGGARKHMDKKLSGKMRELSAELLRDVLSSTDLRAAASHMPLRELNDLVGLLGELREWEALETILSAAWSTRTPSSSYPLTIGLRLAQIRFLLHSHHHSSSTHSSPDPALRLAGDIAYNLLQIWGAGDRSTRRAFAVLAALLVAAGERARAADVLAEALEGLMDAVAVGECTRAEAGRWVGEVWGGNGAVGRECELGDGRQQQQQQRWVGLRGRLEAELGVRLGGLGLGGAWERGKPPAGGHPVCGFATAEGRRVREEEEERDASAWGRGRHGGREEAWMPESWEFLEKGEETVHRNNLRKTSGLDGRVRTPFVIHADKARVPSLSVGSESATTDDEVLGWGDGQLPALREIGQGKGHKVESEEFVMKKLDDGLAGDHVFRMHA